MHGSRATLARLVSNACNTHGSYKQYSWELLAILVDFTYKTRELFRQNPTGLLVKLADIACHIRQHCLLRRPTIDVAPLK